MRRQYHGIEAGWSARSPDNTGDVIEQCMELGADMALLDDAWWGAASLDPNGQPTFFVWERSMPHCIVVDQEGRRLTNESAYCTASVMGRTYPGPGSTLGPAMTFACIAANHIVHSVQGTGEREGPVAGSPGE